MLQLAQHLRLRKVGTVGRDRWARRKELADRTFPGPKKRTGVGEEPFLASLCPASTVTKSFFLVSRTATHKPAPNGASHLLRN